MTTFEILISFIGSGIFLGILGMFYRMGSHHKEIELCFKHFDERFKNLKNDIREIRDDMKEMRKDLSRLDREVGIITGTLKFNGYDLQRHKVEGK